MVGGREGGGGTREGGGNVRAPSLRQEHAWYIEGFYVYRIILYVKCVDLILWSERLRS